MRLHQVEMQCFNYLQRSNVVELIGRIRDEVAFECRAAAVARERSEVVGIASDLFKQLSPVLEQDQRTRVFEYP